MGLEFIADFEREFKKNIGKRVLCKFPCERAGETAEIIELAYTDTSPVIGKPLYKVVFSKDQKTDLIPTDEKMMEMQGYMIITN